jgi:hypothetical protein
VGARVFGFQSSVLGFGFLLPVTDNTELETEDACTEDCAGLRTRSALELKGTTSVVKLNQYHSFLIIATTN